jgi:A/G-specific adenine glycosylase
MRSTPTSRELAAFHKEVLQKGRKLYRDLPWRHTQDPYEIWISEVMLQQTQVSRVEKRWSAWLAEFPTLETLATATRAQVLNVWQGMGYNRRALALLRAARQLVDAGASIPSEENALEVLPGIGATTAAGIRAFAFDLPSVYLDTNVRSVFLYYFFRGESKISDAILRPIVCATCPKNDTDPTDDPRTWYYALLDVGACLKRMIPNPSRQSASYSRQSKFDGSHRQKRAEILKIILGEPEGITTEGIADQVNEVEECAGRPPVSTHEIQRILNELQKEDFCRFNDNDVWLA